MSRYIIAIAGILLLAMSANASFPVNEAGIAAYVNVGQNIDLTKTMGAYQEIIKINKTDIIGKVIIPNYMVDSTPLVYVGADGWIVAYYPKAEPASRIMQWNNYTAPYINTTTLADAISKMTTTLGVDYESIKGNVTYYDFRYPDANEMMMLVEKIDGEGTNSFSILIPGTITLYHQAVSIYGKGWGRISIDSAYFDASYGIKYLDMSGFFKNNINQSGKLNSYPGAGTSGAGASIILVYRHD